MTYYLIMIMYIYIVCVFAWCALRMDKMWVSFSSTVTFRSFLFYFFFSSINTRNTQDGYPLVRRNSNSHEWGKQRLRFSSINHTVCEYMQWYPSKKRNHKCLGGGRQFDFCFYNFSFTREIWKSGKVHCIRPRRATVCDEMMRRWHGTVLYWEKKKLR